tara:strand:+ start:314 stop:784 length:471 start_codon:yes stop_codon:yes gene_type:complete
MFAIVENIRDPKDRKIVEFVKVITIKPAYSQREDCWAIYEDGSRFGLGYYTPTFDTLEDTQQWLDLDNKRRMLEEMARELKTRQEPLRLSPKQLVKDSSLYRSGKPEGNNYRKMDAWKKTEDGVAGREVLTQVDRETGKPGKVGVTIPTRDVRIFS